MSLTISNVTTATSTTAGPTLDLSGVTAAVGDLLVLASAADNAGAAGASSTSGSITDAAGNTWTRQIHTVNSPGSIGSDGTDLSVWTCVVTNALSGATITINFSPDTAAKAAGLKKVSPSAGVTIVVDSVGPGVIGSGTSYSSGNLNVDLGWTIFGFTAAESVAAATGDSDTTNGSWSTAQTASASTGTQPTSQALSTQHKTVTASGNQSYDTTIGGTRDYALNYLLVYEKLTATAAATEAADAAALVGSVILFASMAAVEGTDVLAAAGNVYLAAALATTEAVDVAALAGNIANVATLAPIEGPDSAAIAATPMVFASLVLAESPDRADLLIAPAWPDALPLPTLTGYGLKPSPGVKRAPMEIGAPRVYRRSRRPLAEVQVEWQLSGW